MCGICGRYNLDKRAVNSETIKRMAKAIAHRGPDDEGYYINKNIGLGHKRLSIIDIATGHQPMTNKDQTIWIVYNGEVYNFIELRKDLVKKGYKFKTKSDTEVVLNLYQAYGEKCLEKLNGMFAFVIWDSKKNQLFAARDRLGIKPFYYFFDEKSFVFASEIKSILQDKNIKAQPNNKAINDYLTFQFCLGEKTFFQGIKKLLPGHYLVIKNNKLNLKKYWDIDYTIEARHNEEYFAEKLLELIKDSIKLRLRSDVPVGAHLSGGLDSSIINCLASSYLESPLKSFTGIFRGEGYDESKHAEAVSSFAKTESFKIFPKAQDFEKNLSKLIYFMDEPAAGPGLFPQYSVSQLTSKNVKVVLSGQGGDETFGGYIRYLIAYLEQSTKGIIFDVQKEENYATSINKVINQFPALKNYAPLLGHFLESGSFGDPIDKRYFRLVQRNKNLQTIFNDKFLTDIQEDYSSFAEFQTIFNQPNTPFYFNKMTHFDLKTLLPALLHVEDRTSMAVSLESRVPLLDHRIIEFTATIPPAIKFKNGQTKYILKQAVKNIVPKQIIERKDKIGFAYPWSKWYQGPLKDFLKNTLLDKKAKDRGIYNVKGIENIIKQEQEFGREIWGLLCLELWFKTFIDS